MTSSYDPIEKKTELSGEFNFNQLNPKKLDFLFVNLIFNERIL